jgi:hypothetical protein
MTPKETWALYKQGKDAWNAWAEAAIAEKPMINSELYAWQEKNNAEFLMDSNEFDTRLELSDLIFPSDIKIKSRYLKDDGRVTTSIRKCDVRGKLRVLSNLIIDIHFDSSIFHDGVYITDNHFSGSLTIQDCQFQGEFFLTSCKYERNKNVGYFENQSIYIGESEFQKSAILSDCQTDDVFELRKNIFKHKMEIQRTTFASTVEIMQNIFYSSLNFPGTKIQNNITLTGNEFRVPPDFLQADFFKPPRLEGNKFSRWSKMGSDDAARFRRLRQLASEGNDHESEQDFLPQN